MWAVSMVDQKDDWWGFLKVAMKVHQMEQMKVHSRVAWLVVPSAVQMVVQMVGQMDHWMEQSMVDQ
jgi:hypothetical protein